MLRVDYSAVYGTITYRQECKGKGNGELVTIDIHPANALCAFCYHYEKDGEKWTQLISFFADEQHIKYCEKNFSDHDPINIFMGEITNIRLNLYYKEAKTLLKYFVKKHEVTCYYQKPKE